jgi:hypothetical protein
MAWNGVNCERSNCQTARQEVPRDASHDPGSLSAFRDDGLFSFHLLSLPSVEDLLIALLPHRLSHLGTVNHIAMKWFIGTLRVKNDTKEHAPMPGSIALIKLASQVIGVEQADPPANFSL